MKKVRLRRRIRLWVYRMFYFGKYGYIPIKKGYSSYEEREDKYAIFNLSPFKKYLLILINKLTK